MKRVFKYAVPLVDGPTEILLPVRARILHIGEQGPGFWFWALVDDDALKEMRQFYVFGTGHPIAGDTCDDLRHIGTAQMLNGLVFHFFERVVSGGES